MKKHKITKLHQALILVLFIGILSITSACSDNSVDANEDLTVEEDNANIESSLDNMISLLDELGDGSFSSSLNTFVGASSGNFNSDDWAGDVFSGMEDYIDFESTEDNRRFDFNAHTGLYEYDDISGSWSKSSSANSIVLRFPSSENSSSNDTELTISEYSDVTTQIDGGSYYLPSRLLLQIEKDDEELFRFNLNELQYSDDPDIPVPSVVDLDIYTAPFTHSLNFNRNSSTNFLFNIAVENGDDLVTGLELELDLSHDQFSSIEEGDVENMSGSLHMTSALTIEYDIEVGTLASIDNPTENQINSLFSADILYQGSIIGELVYSEENEDILIVYKDGTSESTARYYEDFAEKVETVFYAFTGDWVDF